MKIVNLIRFLLRGYASAHRIYARNRDRRVSKAAGTPTFSINGAYSRLEAAARCKRNLCNHIC
ncbi:MAG: hypothetical protein GY742_02165 [Hyphomicrobiales bacterium]|nr:hypothetical protein [Hyphomicrobiales bacterium]